MDQMEFFCLVLRTSFLCLIGIVFHERCNLGMSSVSVLIFSYGLVDMEHLLE